MSIVVVLLHVCRVFSKTITKISAIDILFKFALIERKGNPVIVSFKFPARR